ncbi:hypothetical protein SKAU_G00120300 [Synaphobranchus kaupii]|uniref:Uncharacterized protein n=1 Tax=Synaphobranchus kaupii TaxID=118154 RepID=A0A9Q1J1C9_SYNKA|nr:hypothetical protein SKAU_G00120300 [Synaphobranchus kaupii]
MRSRCYNYRYVSCITLVQEAALTVLYSGGTGQSCASTYNQSLYRGLHVHRHYTVQFCDSSVLKWSCDLTCHHLVGRQCMFKYTLQTERISTAKERRPCATLENTRAAAAQHLTSAPDAQNRSAHSPVDHASRFLPFPIDYASITHHFLCPLRLLFHLLL